jgi:hypothetical protein
VVLAGAPFGRPVLCNNMYSSLDEPGASAWRRRQFRQRLPAAAGVVLRRAPADAPVHPHLVPPGLRTFKLEHLWVLVSIPLQGAWQLDATRR